MDSTDQCNYLISENQRDSENIRETVIFQLSSWHRHFLTEIPPNFRKYLPAALPPAPSSFPVAITATRAWQFAFQPSNSSFPTTRESPKLPKSLLFVSVRVPRAPASLDAPA